LSRQGNQTEIARYLLGSLSEEERATLEEKYFSDDTAFEEMQIAEEELIDQYVRAELSNEDNARFAAMVARSPRLAERVEFARVWKDKLSGPVRSAAIIEDASKPVATVHPFLSKSKFSTRNLALAASVIVLIGVLGVWRLFIYEPPIERGLVALQTAYREHRPVEARLSGFNYAPLPNERGSNVKVDSLQRDLAGTLLISQAVQSPNAQSRHAVGQYYLYERQFSKAIEELTEALTQDPNNARIHSDLGAALLEEGKRQRSGAEQGTEFETFGRSLSHLTKAIEIDESLLEARFNLAMLYQNMMPTQEANAWREYLKRDNTSAWAEEAKRNLARLEGNAIERSWDSGASLTEYVNATESKDDDTAWKIISQSYTSGGNEVTNRLLDSLFEDPTNEESENKIRDWLSYVAQLEAAHSGDRFTVDLVRTYEEASPKEKGLLAAARGHMRTGYTLFTQSRFKDAIKEYEQAKKYYQLCNDQSGVALSTYRIAHCHILLPNLSLAHAMLERLIASCGSKNYRWLRAQSLYGMAHVAASNNEYSTAADYSGQALNEFEAVGDLNGILRCFAQLADLNQSLKRVNRSLNYLSRGWQLASTMRAEPMQKWALLIQIGDSMSTLGLHEAALLYHREGLTVASEMGRPLLESRSYGYVAASYAALGRYEEAITEVNRAFETGRTVTAMGGTEIMANASLQLGDISRQAGRCQEAIEAYDRSIELYDQIRQGYYSYSAHKGKLQCVITTSPRENVLAELQTVLDQYESFRSKIMGESERLSFFAAEQSVYDLAIRYRFVEMKDAQKAFELAEASRARSLLDAINSSGQISATPYGPDLTQRTVMKSLQLDQLQRQMDDGTQILQYAVLDDRVLMWIVSKNGFKHAESIVQRGELITKVRDYLKVVTAPSNDGPSLHQAEDLYRLLIAPTLPYLDKSKSLTVVPDKILNFIPFPALISPETQRYLIEDFELNTAPSSSVFAYLSAAATSEPRLSEERLLIVADPHFSDEQFGSLQRLPAATAEASAVSELYPKHRALVWDHATEAALRTEIGAANVLHLAMHYVINDRSEMQSGFPLTPSGVDKTNPESDGFLQAHEIYNLRLPNLRLVILSACQTGIEQQYDGEGAIGIARPFLIAGVPLVIASLWRVDSDASAALMTSFHRYRLNKHVTDIQALKLAQIEMARGSVTKHNHPYYWAGFVSIGGVASF